MSKEEKAAVEGGEDEPCVELVSGHQAWRSVWIISGMFSEAWLGGMILAVDLRWESLSTAIYISALKW